MGYFTEHGLNWRQDGAGTLSSPVMLGTIERFVYAAEVRIRPEDNFIEVVRPEEHWVLASAREASNYAPPETIELCGKPHVIAIR